MATAFAYYGGSTNPKPTLRINLAYSSYSQAGNYSTWYWWLRYEQNTSQHWVGDAVNYGNLSGFVVGGPYYFAIPNSWRGTSNIQYLGGSPAYFTKSHNSSGYLSAGTMSSYSYVDNAPYVTTASVSVGSGTPPRIPKVPSKPVAPVFQYAESDYLAFMIYAPSDNGGSTITAYQMNVVSADGSTVVAEWSDTASLQVSPAVLESDTEYRVRYRARNAIGYSNWSDITVMITEAGIFVSDGTSWKGARILVSDGTEWQTMDTMISDGTAWVIPEPA